MNELETLYCDKRRLNSGYIFFDSSKKCQKMIEVLEQLNIGYMNYIIIINKRIYFGFRIWNIHRQFLILCKRLKEVLEVCNGNTNQTVLQMQRKRQLS